MIEEDHFVRRLPAVMAAHRRFEFESVAFAHDIADVALDALLRLTVECAPPSVNRRQRIAMFEHAWTIVDQIHAARIILARIPERERPAGLNGFLANTEIATLLRNRMDHLGQTLENSANRKGGAMPLFGGLTFFRPFADQIEAGLAAGSIRGELVLLTAGSAPGQMLAQLTGPAFDIKFPICGLRLQAFDMTFDIEAPVIQLENMIREWAEITSGLIETFVADAVGRTEHTSEELLAPSQTEITIVADIAFDVAVETPKI